MRRYRIPRATTLLLICVLAAFAQTPVPSNVKAALDTISAGNLKADLSFLASDALQGRYTPSPGLDIAAEFIAAQFRGAGLTPGGNDGYFQTATMVDRRLPEIQSEMTVQDGPRTFTVAPGSITVMTDNNAAEIDRAPVIVIAARNPALLKNVDLSGKAVIVPQMTAGSPPNVEEMRSFDCTIAHSDAALEVLIGSHKPWQGNQRLVPAEDASGRRVPVILVENTELRQWTELPTDNADLRTISLRIPAPQDQKVSLRNVIGILPGSDPALKNTYVLLTAHYDHIGTTQTAGRMAETRTSSKTDRIYNGANDDGSGTVSVIEIAKALARLNQHPKRSVIFMAFFGEERGELGSQWYGEHPVAPVARTIADINLEQIGRTDSTVGRNVNSLSLTGFDYSEVTAFFQKAGAETGVKVYKDAEASDAYFTRSDNDALARQGVPAHTATVAFDYSDYHGLGDEWQKIDYENMSRVDRALALGLLLIANSNHSPDWNASNPKTLPFRQARQREMGQ